MTSQGGLRNLRSYSRKEFTNIPDESFFLPASA